MTIISATLIYSIYSAIQNLVKKSKTPVNETVTFQPNDLEHGAVINPSAQPEREQPSQLSENYVSK